MLGEDFNVSKIAACVIFNAIGFVALVYGKKNRFWKTMIIGMILIAYPYFVSGALALWLFGIIFTAALYFWR